MSDRATASSSAAGPRTSILAAVTELTAANDAANDAVSKVVSSRQDEVQSVLNAFDFYADYLSQSPSLLHPSEQYPIIYLQTLLLLKRLKSFGHFSLLRDRQITIPRDLPMPQAEDIDAKEVFGLLSQFDIGKYPPIDKISRGAALFQQSALPTLQDVAILEACRILESDATVYRSAASDDQPYFLGIMAAHATDVYHRFIGLLNARMSSLLVQFYHLHNHQEVHLFLDEKKLVRYYFSAFRRETRHGTDSNPAFLFERTVEMLHQLQQRLSQPMQEQQNRAAKLEQQLLRMQRFQDSEEDFFASLLVDAKREHRLPRARPFLSTKEWIVYVAASGYETSQEKADVVRAADFLQAANDLVRLRSDVAEFRGSLGRFVESKTLPRLIAQIDALRVCAAECVAGITMFRKLNMSEERPIQFRPLNDVDTGYRDDIVTWKFLTSYYNSVATDIDHRDAEAAWHDYLDLMSRYEADHRGGWDFVAALQKALYVYADARIKAQKMRSDESRRMRAQSQTMPLKTTQNTRKTTTRSRKQRK